MKSNLGLNQGDRQSNTNRIVAAYEARLEEEWLLGKNRPQQRCVVYDGTPVRRDGRVIRKPSMQN